MLILSLAVALSGVGSSFVSASEPAGSSEARSAEIRISGIESERGGTLLVMVFQEKGFPVQHAAAVHKRRISLTGARARLRVPIPAEGWFAVKVLHDENGDGRVNKRLGIIPKEGMGFSNGARLRFGPPKFAAARLDASALKGAIAVSMQYF